MHKASIPTAGTVGKQLPTSVLRLSARLLESERRASLEAADNEAAEARERVLALIPRRYPGREAEVRQVIRERYEAEIVEVPENATLYESWSQLQNITAFYERVELELEGGNGREYRCGLCHRAECSH